MNTKTTEEKDIAVIAELDRLYDIQQRVKLDLWRITKWRDDYYAIAWREGQERVVIEYFGATTPRGFDPFNTERVYRLLGLEARDAVEAERENYKALEALMIQRNEQINAERARAAKLVEALEEIRKPATIIGFGKKATGKMRAQQLEEDHVRVRTIAKAALAAHKEGGAQNG